MTATAVVIAVLTMYGFAALTLDVVLFVSGIFRRRGWYRALRWQWYRLKMEEDDFMRSRPEPPEWFD